MSDSEELIAWERVAALLSGEETATAEELYADLESQGVDVNKAVAGLREYVRQNYQQHLREQANAEIQAARQKREAVVTEIATWSAAAIREWLKKVEEGLLGSDLVNLAAAYHRNKQAGELTDAEARSLVADILSAKK